mmetsp:Transcript_137081/g.382248  ORF Transcript_137081/g.382248 Transcript_137081/m.382248 type:complete len:615 (-) Transcript_137081:428-2272(-)
MEDPDDSESKSSESIVDLGSLPDTVERHCTDVASLTVFILSVLGLVFCMYYGLRHGHLFRAGDLCGHGQNEGKPYFFFCLRNDTRTSVGGAPAVDISGTAVNGTALILDTAHPLCIESCPSGASTSHICDPYSQAPIPDYATEPFIGMICRPQDPGFAYQLSDWVLSNHEVHLIATFSSLVRAWQALAACAVLSVVFSYGYIFILRNCAAFLVWSGFVILTVVPLVTSAMYFWCWKKGGCSTRFSANPQGDLVKGGFLLIVGICFLLLITRRGDSVNLAVDCLQASCACVMEINCLKLVPLISFCCRTVLLALQMGTTMLLISCGQPKDIIGNWFRLEPTPGEWAMLIFSACAFFWLHQVVSAVTDFVTIYSAEVWYFSPRYRVEGIRCTVWRAYWTAARYHLGTLALGGLSLGITSPLRIVLRPLESHARTAHTPVGFLIGCCCCCCVSCFDRFFAFLTYNAYMDVAMNSTGFCQAARDALDVQGSEEEAIQILNGATWLFQIFGLCCIALLGDTVTFTIVRHSSFADTSDPHYVHNPEIMGLSGSIIAAFVAVPFLMIFDTVSDTIIYCYAVRQRRAAAQGGEQPDGCLLGAISTVSGWVSCLLPHKMALLR